MDNHRGVTPPAKPHWTPMLAVALVRCEHEMERAEVAAASVMGGTGSRPAQQPA